jgi:hypothetical protein
MKAKGREEEGGGWREKGEEERGRGRKEKA